ncbi:MAG: cysteine sulfinate desulfinase [Deltaproteobacteria bacterium RIFOXYA12_FULL_58_15]|nr:MAG: cysteine sulfinate desulfinase [Deltaproteobacteria bacterium RIFOXYA12_FULL_58_15]
MAINPYAIRRDFPALQQSVHGKPLVYLDTAATAQKPNAVIDAVAHFYRHDCANVHRAVHALGERASAQYEAARKKVQSFLGAQHSEEIVFVRSTTEAINLVANTFGRSHIQAGDEIIVSEMEHHSNIVPWQLLTQSVGASLLVIPFNEQGELDLDAYATLLGEKTRLVAIGHVSNALGTINPIAQMIEIAHDRGIPVLVDGAQAVAHMSVNVRELDCDFYAFSGHKLYGPTGIGVLYGKREILASMPPYQGGGDMIANVTFEKTTYADPPQRFEAGTPNVAGAIGLSAAIDYVTHLGIGGFAEHEDILLRRATEAITSIPGCRIYGQASAKVGVVSFTLDGVHPHDLATIVDREGVAIRAGHHCAQPVWQHYGIAATARASLGVYNTPEDVDTLMDALDIAAKLFR